MPGTPITRDQLTTMLRNTTLPKEVTFYHVATPDMKKKGNPYLDCVRHATVKGIINFSYEGIVNADMPEGFEPFKAGPRVWGQRIHGSPLVEHKGEFYLETLPTLKTISTYWSGDENSVIPTPDITPFLKKPEEIELDMPRPKDYRVSGIRWIDLENQRFVIQ